MGTSCLRLVLGVILFVMGGTVTLTGCGGDKKAKEAVGEAAGSPAEAPLPDNDGDDDGVADDDDAFPLDPAENADADGDGVGDNADTFPEDATETVDTDGDGVGDSADTFPNDASETADTDGDGVGDVADALPNDASETSDSDSDGVGNNADVFPNDATETADTDGDGVGDVADNCDDTTNAAQTDTDGDSTGDACDTDDDGDGVLDTTDNCVLTSNAAQTDTDSDDSGDACDDDDDGDDVADTTDNCVLTANAGQEDLDSDDDGDDCDDDDNGNGITDVDDPDTDQLTYWVATDGDDANDGDIDAPLASLATAIDLADDVATAIRNVYVVDGTYTLDAALSLVDGVSLYGGFGALADETRVRSLTTLATILTGAADAAVITSPPGVATDTVVDGFEINAGGSTGTSTAVSILNGSPTISNSDISSAEGTADSVAIRIAADGTGDDASPVIEDNVAIIAGRGTTGDSVAIDIEASGGGTASPIIRRNDAIRAGRASDDSFGIRVLETDDEAATTASLTLEENTIEGAGHVVATGESYGVALGFDTGAEVQQFSTADIRRNTIHGGGGSVLAVGLSIVAPETLTEVSNNLIAGVDLDADSPAGAGGVEVRGVEMTGGEARVALVNNTLDTGAVPATATGIIALFLEADSSGVASNPYLVNNILTSSSAGDGIGVVEVCVACDPTSFENQLLDDAAGGSGLTTYYSDEGGMAMTSDLVTINGFTGSSANVEGDPTFTSLTFGDAGFLRIGTGSAAIDEGQDASALDLDGDGAVDVTLTDDVDGDARPAGAAYDIGADELP